MEHPRSLSLATVAVFAFSVLLVGGCGSSTSDAPTNTAHSTYIGDGKTAADKIGEERAKAHHILRQARPGAGEPAPATP